MNDNKHPVFDHVAKEREHAKRVANEPEPFDWNATPEIVDATMHQPRHAREHNERTPNVVVESPAVRRIANIVLGIAGLALGAVMTADALSANIDLNEWTVPAFGVYGFLAGAFGLAVTTPNIPGER